MIAEYNKWYPCKEGSLPEDFENIPMYPNGEETEPIVVWFREKPHQIGASQRCFRQEFNYKSYYEKAHWEWTNCSPILAWMLPEPYKE